MSPGTGTHARRGGEVGAVRTSLMLAAALVLTPSVSAFSHPSLLALRPARSALSGRWAGGASGLLPAARSAADRGLRNACGARAALGPEAAGWAAASFGTLARSVPSPLAQDVVCGVVGVIGAALWLGISRKIVHCGSGPLFLLTWPFFSASPSAGIVAALVPVINDHLTHVSTYQVPAINGLRLIRAARGLEVQTRTLSRADGVKVDMDEPEGSAFRGPDGVKFDMDEPEVLP
ncbi:hypothetical protein T484DRAFT_1823012 [Baffinella frigidus]|nr:hypothetical protein T484DRAFT_1823012 [Cryptophyta sp. CCMP2293]